MARTITAIKSEMTEAFVADATIVKAYGLNESKNFDEQFSKVSIESILFYIVAVCVWTLEKLFDTHKTEINATLTELMPHTTRWYRNKALAFQYGFDLIENSDSFNNDNYTDDEIAASKIIKYSSVVESENESRLIIKIATKDSDKTLSPVSDAQLTAFKEYISEIKDAGVRVTVINYLPDRLKLTLRIIRDSLVLDANGMSIMEANYPVNEAIEAFMKELPFNGELSLQALVDKIQAVDGVKDLSLDLAQTAWIDANSASYGNWQSIDISSIPVSGYFAVNLDNKNEPGTLSHITYV